WLPPETPLHGRFCPVLPHVTTTFSHGTPSISAATRCVSLNDSVPRLPMPDWIYILPSGLITNSPSKPTQPETNTLDETPYPRTSASWRLPPCSLRSTQRNRSAPRSSACFMH